MSDYIPLIASPLQLIAFLFAIFASVIVTFYRINQRAKLEKIEKDYEGLSEEGKKEVIKVGLKLRTPIPPNMSAIDYLQYKKNQNNFWLVLAIIGAVVITIVLISNSKPTAIAETPQPNSTQFTPTIILPSPILPTVTSIPPTNTPTPIPATPTPTLTSPTATSTPTPVPPTTIPTPIPVPPIIVVPRTTLVPPPIATSTPSPTTSGIAILYNQLLDAENKQDWARVINLGEQILKVDANYQQTRAKTAIAYTSLGVIYHNQQNYDAAIKDFNRAIELKPDYGRAYNGRGSSYAARKQYDQAVSEYTKAIAFNYIQAYYNRGVIYHLQANDSLATNDSKQFIQLADPNDPLLPDAYLSLGNSYAALKNYNEAIIAYGKAIDIRINFTNAYLNRGLIYELTGDKENAKKDLQKAADLGSDTAKKELDKLN